MVQPEHMDATALVTALSPALSSANEQGWGQVGDLLLAFFLSSLIGLERELRGKSAGLRTQAIVGTAAALLMLVSKYGFTDVVEVDLVRLDPSRVAAQIVSGVGFLGAGLILTRQGAVHGLTTAAAVWQTAAIGMAAGANLPILAAVVTGLHFVIVLGFTPLSRRLPGSRTNIVRLQVRYLDGRGVLRQTMAAITASGWVVRGLSAEQAQDIGDGTEPRRAVSVVVELAGSGDSDSLLARLAAVEGVLRADMLSDEDVG